MLLKIIPFLIYPKQKINCAANFKNIHKYNKEMLKNAYKITLSVIF